MRYREAAGASRSRWPTAVIVRSLSTTSLAWREAQERHWEEPRPTQTNEELPNSTFSRTESRSEVQENFLDYIQRLEGVKGLEHIGLLSVSLEKRGAKAERAHL